VTFPSQVTLTAAGFRQWFRMGRETFDKKNETNTVLVQFVFAGHGSIGYPLEIKIVFNETENVYK
jgi:hypothetical protein